jgi:fructokinase
MTPMQSEPAFRITALGEVLWDMLPDGPCFGGAPANFACSAKSLAGPNAEVHMVSAVGRDLLGDRALENLTAKGVRTGHMAQLDTPTGQVDVELDAKGVARYTFATDPAWDHLPWTPPLETLAQETDAVCFGSLGQRHDEAGKTIQRFLEHTRPECLRIFDINLRPPFWTPEVVLRSLACANVLKLNEEELPVVAGYCNVSGSEEEQLAQLVEHYDLRVAALTCGADGALLVAPGQSERRSAAPTDVVDTVGAGDAFVAAMTLGLLADYPLDKIIKYACAAAEYVCSQRGATPELPDSLTMGPITPSNP